MLTSFDYYEQAEKLVPLLKNPFLFEQELDIIKEIVDHADVIKEWDTGCPFCGEKKSSIFFKKWDVPYYRCPQCFSIYARIDGGELEKYKKNESLKALRLDQEYQSDTGSRRVALWNDLLDWYRFRCFRYLGRNQDLRVLDFGTRYLELIRLLADSGLAGRYELRNSILEIDFGEKVEQADVILCMDYIQQESDPLKFLQEICKSLKEDGLLFFSTRMGSGIDVLALKEKNKSIFPYEFNLLPTPQGLYILLEKAGFEILELTTPGTLDVSYLHEQADFLEHENAFLHYFLKNARAVDLADFQRFLQKSGMSSYAQLVARKVK
jgi:SAM-dependent methyltransferase